MCCCVAISQGRIIFSRLKGRRRQARRAITERTTDALRLLPAKQQFQEIDPLLKFHWFQMEAPQPGSTGKQKTGRVHYRSSEAVMAKGRCGPNAGYTTGQACFWNLKKCLVGGVKRRDGTIERKRRPTVQVFHLWKIQHVLGGRCKQRANCNQTTAKSRFRNTGDPCPASTLAPLGVKNVKRSIGQSAQ